MTDPEQFLWGLAATDVEFGPDGALYVSDWVEGWRMTMKGRVFKAFDPGHDLTDVRDAWVALRDRLGRDSIAIGELSSYLLSPDMRVRQEAQFALAARGPEAVESLRTIVRNSDRTLPRIHALWALGQISRKDPGVIDHVAALLDDTDAEVRAQAAKVVGEARRPADVAVLVRRLGDDSPRVRFFAAIALGRIGPAARAAAGPLVELLRENQDTDLYLRHAAVMGLAGVAGSDSLRAAAADRSAAVRMGVLLAMRQLRDPEIARLLDDPEPTLAREAARAIYETPIDAALPALAARIERPESSDDAALLRRIINAAARRGSAADARALGQMSARGAVPESIRVEVLQILSAWSNPPGIDRVTGLWRPTPARPAGDACRALAAFLPAVLRDAPEPVRLAALRALGPLPLESAGATLLEIAANGSGRAEVRAEAIRALERLHDPRLAQAVARAVNDPVARVRIEGQRLQAKIQPEKALPLLKDVLERGSIAERQGALVALSTVPGPEADAVIAAWLDRLQNRQAPPEITHELLEAARSRAAGAGASTVNAKLRRYEEALPGDDPLAHFLESLAGGDAARGAALLREKAEVSCIRCHKVDGKGGEVGPDLTGVGKRQDRRYLLESIVAPNRQIARGFETLVIATSDGQVQSGILKEDDGKNLRLITPEGKMLTVPRAEIEEQKRGVSAMPEDLLKHLSKSELRDLVEYLAGLK
jgi:quinoprotein glucose dehydrogenase